MHQNLLKLIFLLSVLQLTASASGNGTLCYSCSDTIAGGRCQSNLQEMADAAGSVLGHDTGFEGEVNTYVKNCTSYENSPYCVIEVIDSRGFIPSFTRDCSTIVRSPFPVKKFEEARPDNQTTCAYYTQGYLACIRLCSGDFCNGPKPTSIGNVSNGNEKMLIILLVVTILWQ